MARLMHKLTALLGMAVLSVSLSLPAKAQMSNMSGIHHNYDGPVIISFLEELGLTYDLSLMEDGTPLFLVKVGENKTVIMVPTRCTNADMTNCHSMLMMAMGNVSMLPYTEGIDNLALMNGFNELLDYTKVYISSNNLSPIISRGLMADYGVAKGNFLANLQMFIASADIFFGGMAEIKASGATSLDDTVAGSSLAETLQGSLGQTMALPLTEPSDKVHKALAGLKGKNLSMSSATSDLLNNPSFQAITDSAAFRLDYGYQAEVDTEESAAE